MLTTSWCSRSMREIVPSSVFATQVDPPPTVRAVRGVSIAGRATGISGGGARSQVRQTLPTVAWATSSEQTLVASACVAALTPGQVSAPAGAGGCPGPFVPTATDG